MRESLASTILSLILTLMLLPNVQAQQRPDSPSKAQVLILAVYHFDNPNLDYVKTSVDDHLSKARQEQILEVVDLLSMFRPTKIILEAVDSLSPINRNYQAYLKGEYTLKADEREQLGLRLAKQLGHKRVYPIDHKLDMDVASVIAAARQSKDRVFLETFQKAMSEIEGFEKRKTKMTVRAILAEMNDPVGILKARDLYLQLARVRSGNNFIGADVLAGWYQRNFRIFSNLTRVIETKEDRILIMYGASHAAILRELVQSSPDLQLIEANDYLIKQRLEK